MQQSILAAIITASILSGCASVNQSNNVPIVDNKGMTAECYAALQSDNRECAAIAFKASTEGAGMALWGVLAGDMRRADALKEKERIVKRECLKGRGWGILY